MFGYGNNIFWKFDVFETICKENYLRINIGRLIIVKILGIYLRNGRPSELLKLMEELSRMLKNVSLPNTHPQNPTRAKEFREIFQLFSLSKCQILVSSNDLNSLLYVLLKF